MKKKTVYFLTAALFLGANFFALNTASQTNSFKMGQILRAIASIGEAKPAERENLRDRIIADIRRRKVDFPLTKDNEKLLREEGATDEIIEAIRQNSLPLPTPTPTPKPSATPFVTPTPYISPASSESYLKQARQYRSENRLDEANTAYTKAIEADPNNAQAYFERGDMNSNNFSDKEKIRKAFEDYTQAIRLKTDNALYYFYRGILYQYYSRNYQSAIDDYDMAIRVSPKNYVFYYNRGLCYEGLEKYNQAIADYRKVLALKSDDKDTQQALDRVLKKQK